MSSEPSSSSLAKADSLPLLRSKLSWTLSLAFGAFGSALAFVSLNWNGCWLFRSTTGDLWNFVYFFGWLIFFFAVRWRWRALLLAITLPIAFLYFGLHGLAEQNAGPEAAAVAGLRRFYSALQDYRATHPQLPYPPALPAVSLHPSAEKFYLYEYFPRRSTDGAITGYLIQATPVRRDCEFHRSFTLSENGKIFWTYNPRPATPSDPALE